jgi:hypothetical protein
MSNLISYLDENAEFQNFLQGKAQMAQAAAAEKKEELTGGLETLTLSGAPLLEKIGSGVKKTMELYNKGSEAVSKLKTAGIKVDEALNQSEMEGGDIFQNIADKVASRVSSGASNLFNEASSNAISNVSKIGANMSKRLQMSEFERDPESELASLNENRGLVDNVRSIFRSTGEKISSTAEEGMTGARGIAQEGMAAAKNIGEEAASQIGSKVSSIAGEIGAKAGEIAAEAIGETAVGAISEAVPVVGELALVGMGIYDLFHGFHAKPTPVSMMARPVYNAGL